MVINGLLTKCFLTTLKMASKPRSARQHFDIDCDVLVTVNDAMISQCQMCGTKESLDPYVKIKKFDIITGFTNVFIPSCSRAECLIQNEADAERVKKLLKEKYQ